MIWIGKTKLEMERRVKSLEKELRKEKTNTLDVVIALQAENRRLKTVTGLLCRGCDKEINEELDGCKFVFCNNCLDKIEQALKGKGELK